MRQKKRYDLILMDIQMPILGGIEATEQIIDWEQEEEEVHVPIIALTANTLRGDREKYLAVGMDDYLSKPIDIAHLKKLFSQYCPAEKTETTKSEENDCAVPTVAPAKKEEDQGVQAQEKLSNDEVLLLRPAEGKKTEDSTGMTRGSVEPAEAKEILMLGGNSLVKKIHQTVLQNLGYEIDHLDNIALLLETVEAKRYGYILIPAAMVDTDVCIALEVLSEMGTLPLILSGEKKEYCSGVFSYASIKELKHLLQSIR